MKKRVEKNRRINELHPLLLQLLQRLNSVFLKAAAYLQEKTARASSRQKTVALALFCFIFIVINAAIIIRNVNKELGLALTSARIKTIRLQKDGNNHPVNTQEALVKVRKFRSYMDSLGTTEKGIKMRDSLLKGHPHLLDTINYLLKQFGQQ